MQSTLALASGSAAEWVTAAGTILLGAVAGTWTFVNRRKDRRAEAARWVREIFRDFYLDERFDEIKSTIEYDYPETLEPLLEQRLTSPHLPVGAQEIRLLGQLDMFLNYFEHLLYLEEEGHFSERDQQAVFRYWFDLMRSPQRAAVQRYVAQYEFRRLASSLRAAGG